MQTQQRTTSLFDTPSAAMLQIAEMDSICDELNEHELVSSSESDLISIRKPVTTISVRCNTYAQISTISDSRKMYIFFTRNILKAIMPIAERKGWFVANIFVDESSIYPNTLKVELTRDSSASKALPKL